MSREQMQLGIATNAKEAGCYTFIEEHFFVAGNESIDPGLVKRIRSFWPEYVPLLCRRRYVTPAGTEVLMEYHIIGRYIENPTDGYAEDTVKLTHVPHGFPYNPEKIHSLRTLWAPWPGPHYDEAGDYQSGCVEWENGTPPAPVQPGEWMVEQLRAVNKIFDTVISLESNENGDLEEKQKQTAQDKVFDILQAESRRDEKIQQEAMGEARKRMHEIWPALKRAADEGRWQPEPPEPKPFIDLGG